MATALLTGVSDPDSLDGAARAAMDAWSAAPSGATRDAARLPGRFPIVVYVSGSGASFDDDAARCARLASLGYLVVSSAWQRGDGTRLSTHDLQGSVERDIGALLVAAAREFGGDLSRVGAVGHSAGAQSLVRWQVEGTSPARGVVILDTTQDAWSLLSERWEGYLEFVRARSRFARGALLFVTGPEAQFQVGDTLSGAERWYLTVPDLEHDDYIAQGIAGRRVRLDAAARRGRPDTAGTIELARVRIIHDFVEERTIAFLEATVRGDSAARATLAVPFADPRSRAEYRAVGDHAPPPWRPQDGAPTPAQWRRRLQGGDREAAFRELAAAWPRDSAAPAFSPAVAVALIDEYYLSGDSVAARALYAGYRGVAPALANAVVDRLLLWGRAMTLTRPDDPAAAIRWYRKVLMIAPGDPKATARLEALTRSP